MRNLKSQHTPNKIMTARLREIPYNYTSFSDREIVLRILGDEGIVRHRGKIEATINNARRCLDLIETDGSLAAFAWRFEPIESERPRRRTWEQLRTITTTPTSIAMSRELKRRGWTFVGPTTMYALMQAMGLVNDHVDGCHVQGAADRARASFVRPMLAR